MRCILYCCVVWIWISLLSAKELETVTLTPTNLLLIMFDDLRPDLSIYGRSFMITPNFERLAKRSLVFDNAYCQVAVCNPSRDSLLTGLRPDSVGTYNFGHSYWPHMTLPVHLQRSGFHTVGIGKLHHWETKNKEIWSFDRFDGKWYEYQRMETIRMNSSVMPETAGDETFRDYLFTTKALSVWDKLRKGSKRYMLAIGYKMPHTSLHVPRRYFEMYKNRKDAWKLSKKELRFPMSAPLLSYRCCAEPYFRFMNDEGRKKANKSITLGDINAIVPKQMHDELMMGYAAAVTFVDRMLGRLLDYMDQHDLWKNTTLVLTSDHGMHNGEKGMWEKWTLFDESTRVPLLLAHPQSPMTSGGGRYRYPVELIDIYPTVLDLVDTNGIPRERVCYGLKCKRLQGKSLAPLLFHPLPFTPVATSPSMNTTTGRPQVWIDGGMATDGPRDLPPLAQIFAISQSLRCAPKSSLSVQQHVLRDGVLVYLPETFDRGNLKSTRKAIWKDCDLSKIDPALVHILGYSMRYLEYRYTAYFHLNTTSQLPMLHKPVYAEELYDHKNESLADFTHREVFNLAVRSQYNATLSAMRKRLVAFVSRNVVFGDH